MIEYKDRELIITDSRISFTDKPGEFVMMEWERPLMKRHAEIVCQDGGHILEIGFGLGISAGYIQQENIILHTIIEINDDIYQILLEWSKDKPNVIPIKGDWFELSNNLELDKYDGIFYDGYGGVNEMKIKEFAIKHVKNNGLFTYFNLTKRNFLKFDNLKYETVEVDVDPDCNYCGPNPTSLKEVYCPWVRIDKSI
jgi:type IV protein arginine methyltransferase